MTEKVLHEFTAKNGAKFRVRESREPNGMSVIEEIGSDGYWCDVRPTQLPSALHESIWINEILRLSAELARANREIARIVNGDTTYFEWQHGLEPPREEESMSTLDRKILAAASSARRAGRDDGLRAALEAMQQAKTSFDSGEQWMYCVQAIERLIEDDKGDDDE